MENSLRNQIIQRIENYDYLSAKFRLILIKEYGIWKILTARIILDISKPQENVTLMEEDNFAIEDIFISIEDFRIFLDYLDSVYIGKISPEGKVEIKDELLFDLGKYKLCFVGNYPGSDTPFQNRHDGRRHYGIDAPFYSADYAIHQSVAGKAVTSLDLTGADIPLRNVSEAINHFWGTNFEQHSISNYCNIYMPIFEASINSVIFKETKMELKIDLDETRVKLNELSVSVIAEKKEHDDFRKKFDLKEKTFIIDFGFTPERVSVFLIHKFKKLDELNHYDYKPINIPRSVRPVQYRNDFSLDIGNANNEQKLFDQDLVAKLPSQIQSLLSEAQNAFDERLYRASVILFRSAIEEGVMILLKQIGKENELYDAKNFEAGLGKKIKLITEYMPSLSQVKTEFNDVKWFGDKASHEANMPINEQDISVILEPKLRLILAKFIEEMK
jgi:hypothetical protein